MTKAPLSQQWWKNLETFALDKNDSRRWTMQVIDMFGKHESFTFMPHVHTDEIETDPQRRTYFFLMDRSGFVADGVARHYGPIDEAPAGLQLTYSHAVPYTGTASTPLDHPVENFFRHELPYDRLTSIETTVEDFFNHELQGERR